MAPAEEYASSSRYPQVTRPSPSFWRPAVRHNGPWSASLSALRLNAGCASEAFTLHVRDLAGRLVQRLPSDEHVRARSDPCVLEAVYLLVGFPERRADLAWLSNRDLLPHIHAPCPPAAASH